MCNTTGAASASDNTTRLFKLRVVNCASACMCAWVLGRSLLCRDETTVLAFNGLGKVLRAHMAAVLAISGFNEKWDEISRIAAQALMSGRKSVAVAAAQLLTGFLQVRTLPI